MILKDFPPKKTQSIVGVGRKNHDSLVFRPIFCSPTTALIFFSPAPAARPALRLDWPPGNASDSAVDLDHDGNRVKKNATRRDQVNIAFGTGEARPVSDRKGGSWWM